MKLYERSFYERRHRETAYAASTILTICLESLPPIRSTIDVGCGVGTWLNAISNMGVTEIQGVDGPWIDRRLLVVPQDAFLEHDLTQPIQLDKRYDLAISLEVAEHLPPESAAAFVQQLTRLADFVLFSAAIPYQGGRNHLNEQWPTYWSILFAEEGYLAQDIVRQRIWTDSQVPVWYRQNSILFVRRERLPELTIGVEREGKPLSLVHPELYLAKLEGDSLRTSGKILWRSLQRLLRRCRNEEANRSTGRPQ